MHWAAGLGGDLSEDQLQVQIEFIEKLIRRGLSKRDAFDILEAENRLAQYGPIEPSEELVKVVLKTLSGPSYHRNFDLIRICGYLLDDRIREVLEGHFADLKVIWREQDELRLLESQRTFLSNIERRAEELGALSFVADPILSTLDEFFKRSFESSRLKSYPELLRVRDGLQSLREAGRLNKASLRGVLTKARSELEKLFEAKDAELEERQGSERIKPNSLIAVYYCLLESLMLHRSDHVRIDEDFLEKVGQDFRASFGDGTKRFVLSSLLKLRHESFAGIAAEARFSIRGKTVEKIERKEAGDPAFRTTRVELAELQNYYLYETASEIIARNPSDEVFQTLLNSHNLPSLLLGLRALELADMQPYVKLRHVKVLLDLGVVDEYIFARAVKILGGIQTAEAAAVLTRILIERYSWQRVKLPPVALGIIRDGIYGIRGSAGIAAVAWQLDKKNRDLEEGALLTFPYAGEIYDDVFHRLALRFDKNPFHGANELAQYRIFRALLPFIFKTRHSFALAGKRRALILIRALYQVSTSRLEKMIEEFREALQQYKSKVIGKSLGREGEAARKLQVEAQGTLSRLKSRLARPSEEERVTRGACEAVRRCLAEETEANLRQAEMQLRQLRMIGPSRMKQREANLRAAAKKTGRLDMGMLPVRFSIPSSLIIEFAPLLLHFLGEVELKEDLSAIPAALGVTGISSPPSGPAEEMSADFARMRWSHLEHRLALGVAPEDGEILVNEVFEIASAAAAHGLADVIEGVRTVLYGIAQPPLLRLAFLLALPAGADYAELWSELLASEDEQVLTDLSLSLDDERKRNLGAAVPDLMDLLG